ncbi:MAG: hypothetical protein IVW36_00855 [Dehalococcoidia bacterium]|nr:hypothetical protein [Dehalococcoidia bacterium]
MLGLLRDGLSNDEISQRLGVTLATAKFHVSEILSKLGVASRGQAARWRPERRGAWLTSLLARRNISPVHTVARVLAGAGVVVVVGTIAALAWGVTRSSCGATPDGDANGGAWTINDSHASTAPGILVFDLTAHAATRVPVSAPAAYAEWAGGDRFIARTDQGNAFGPWMLLSADGATLRQLAASDALVDAAPNGDWAVIVESGHAHIVSLTSDKANALDIGIVSDARVSPDGAHIAFRLTGGSDKENTVHDYVNVMTSQCRGVDDNGCGSAMSIQFQRESSGFLNMMGAETWSPDGKYLLLSRQAGCETTPTPDCHRQLAFEVYGTDLSNNVIWHDYEGRLTGAEWAGPGTLMVTFANAAQGDPSYPSSTDLLVTLGVGKHSVPDIIEHSCCVSFSPDGRYVIAYVGADAGERCALFDTQVAAGTPWKELAALPPHASDSDGFCSYVDWAPDSSRAIVSRAGN